MDWKERFETMKKHFGWTNADIAEMIGNSPDSVKNVLSRKDIPRWAKLAVIVYEHFSRACT